MSPRFSVRKKRADAALVVFREPVEGGHFWRRRDDGDMRTFSGGSVGVQFSGEREHNTLTVADAPVFARSPVWVHAPIEERRDPGLEQLIHRQPEERGELVEAPHLKPGALAVEELIERGSMLEPEAFCQQRFGFLPRDEQRADILPQEVQGL